MASEVDREEENEILELGLEFDFQTDSLSEIPRNAGFPLEMLELLPDVYCWKKDVQGKYTYVSKALSSRLGRVMMGKDDEELYSPVFARQSKSEDERVMQLRITLKNKPELVPCLQGGTEWRETSKIPLIDAQNKVIGLAGISRPIPMLEGVSMETHYREVISILAYIYENLEKEITVVDVAKYAGVSASTLERIFKKHFSITPKKWIAQARISVVCKHLLESDTSIQSIATTMGYDDHANFTRAFGSVLGMSPREYRKKYAKKENLK